MDSYLVFEGVYPFKEIIGTVIAEDDESALSQALKTYGKKFPHCVVELLQLSD